MKVRMRVADAIRACWDGYNREHAVPPHAAKAVRRMLLCRTAALGGHMHRCDNCGSELPVYNSCEDRHCPTCQGHARRKWTGRRMREILPVQYFHLVFTLPHSLNPLVDANRKLLFNEFFHVVGWVLQRFAHDPQWRLEGELGYIALLHTWNQRLLGHFHIHCLVPGGVWREQTQEWIDCRRNWLFGKDPLAKAFRNRFIKRLRSLRRRGKLSFAGCAAGFADTDDWERILTELAGTKWVAYPKKVPARPEDALRYLARYTHKVAISDSRVKEVRDGHVVFAWRDRSDGNREKLCRIPAEEFTRRFLYHILPESFHKIRYGGWMSAPKRRYSLRDIRKALGAERSESPEETGTLPERILEETGIDVALCPFCGKGHLVRTEKHAPLETEAIAKPP